MIGAAIGVIGLLVGWYFWSHESPRLRRERMTREQENGKTLREVVREGNETLMQGITRIIGSSGRPFTPAESEELHKLAQTTYSTTLSRIDETYRLGPILGGADQTPLWGTRKGSR
jgi:hypothetical protein